MRGGPSDRSPDGEAARSRDSARDKNGSHREPQSHHQSSGFSSVVNPTSGGGQRPTRRKGAEPLQKSGVPSETWAASRDEACFSTAPGDSAAKGSAFIEQASSVDGVHDVKKPPPSGVPPWRQRLGAHEDGEPRAATSTLTGLREGKDEGEGQDVPEGSSVGNSGSSGSWTAWSGWVDQGAGEGDRVRDDDNSGTDGAKTEDLPLMCACATHEVEPESARDACIFPPDSHPGCPGGYPASADQTFTCAACSHARTDTSADATTTFASSTSSSDPPHPSCSCFSDMPDGRQSSADQRLPEGYRERVSHVAVERDFFAPTPPSEPESPRVSQPEIATPRTTSQSADAEEAETIPSRPRQDSETSSIFPRETVDDKALGAQGWNENEPDPTCNAAEQSYLTAIRTNFLDPVMTFLYPKFQDKDIEQKFRREKWFMTKRTALPCSLFVTVQWILLCALMHYRASWIYGAYIVLCGFFAVTLPFFVIFDGPLRANAIYQFALACTVWSTGVIITVEMDTCGESAGNGALANAAQAVCGHKELSVAFMLFGVVFGVPTLAVIGLQQNRILHIACAAVWMVLSAALLLRNPTTPPMFIRNLVIMLIYHTLLASISHLRERTDRQLFLSRNQIRKQNVAMREAQAMEQKAQAIKKSFVSYIFHEVRVPLNTALLALQNLDGEDVFRDLNEDQAIMVNGLMGSLTMMEKVLNDVLSHSRMEQGTLVQAKEPFDFHKSMHIVGLSYRSQSELSGVGFELELDPSIDSVAPAFIGDEMRLRQITSNLVSNALKFTAAGGKVRLVTRLVYPPLARSTAIEFEDEVGGSIDLGKPEGSRHQRRSFNTGGPPKRRPLPRSVSSPPALMSNSDRVVVRVEVHDTGVGIKESDLENNNLFSPYIQTEIGRRQGGKGSGLGLALVMQIIRLSKGRLGVDSEVGKGSCFWFEMPYTIPTASDELPQESRHILLTKPSFLHVMGSPHVAMTGLPSRRDWTTSAEDYFNSINEASESMRPPLSHHRSMEDKPRPPPSPRRVRSHSSGGSYFRNIQGSQLQSIPSSPPASFHADPLNAAGADQKSAQSSVNQDKKASFPPVSMRTRRMSSVSSISPRQAGASLPPASAKTAAFSTALPDLTPSSPPGSPPNLNRFPSDETDIRTPDLSPRLNPAELYQPFAGTLSSMSEQSTSPTTEMVPSIDETPKAKPDLPAKRQLSGRALSALVVDDDSLTRRLMSRMLSRLGHTVTAVDNGRKAVDLVLENASDSPFDVVFLDNQMPIMTGVEAVAALRAAGCDTYVVGCTGNALREDQDEYITSGADAIIPKPVHQAAILEHLAEARRRSDAKMAA